MLKKILGLVSSEDKAGKEAKLYSDFLRHEAKIGGELFGPLPPGGRREFFCLDEHTWVWHEEWIDDHGARQVKTTRYDIRPSGIVKAQDGQGYQAVTPEEAKRLYKAAKLYEARVRSEIYDPILQQ